MTFTRSRNPPGWRPRPGGAIVTVPDRSRSDCGQDFTRDLAHTALLLGGVTSPCQTDPGEAGGRGELQPAATPSRTVRRPPEPDGTAERDREHATRIGPYSDRADEPAMNQRG